MREVLNFLKENPIQYVATLGLDGKAKVRPMEFTMEDNGELYFCTNNKKPLYKELQKSPDLELTVSTPEYTWLRIKGTAKFTKDIKIKEKAYNISCDCVKKIFKDATDPNFAVFSIKGTAAITSRLR